METWVCPSADIIYGCLHFNSIRRLKSRGRRGECSGLVVNNHLMAF